MINLSLKLYCFIVCMQSPLSACTMKQADWSSKAIKMSFLNQNQIYPMFSISILLNSKFTSCYSSAVTVFIAIAN